MNPLTCESDPCDENNCCVERCLVNNELLDACSSDNTILITTREQCEHYCANDEFPILSTCETDDTSCQ